MGDAVGAANLASGLSDALDRLESQCDFAEDDINSLQLSINAEILSQRRIRRIRLIAAGMVATLLLLLGIGGWMYNSLYQRIDSYDSMLAQVINIGTERGDRMYTHLPDGSRVDLGPLSRVSYSLKGFSKHGRCVTVEGEARFKVVHNPSAPFRVNGQGFAIEVLGTTFTVDTREQRDRAEIHLVDGSICLTPAGSTAVVMHPGQTAVIDKSSGRLSMYDASDSYRPSTCHTRYYDSAPLSTVLADLAIYYNRDCTVQADCSNRTFSGALPTDDLQQALYILEHTLQLTFAPTSNGGYRVAAAE